MELSASGTYAEGEATCGIYDRLITVPPPPRALGFHNITS